MVSLSFSIWKCCRHIEMWVKEAPKSEGRAVGHVTCTELVADWAFSLIKADQLAFLLSKSRSNRAGPCLRTPNEIGGRVLFLFYTPFDIFDIIGPATFLLSLMFRGGIRPRTTSLVVVRKARTPRTSRAPSLY